MGRGCKCCGKSIEHKKSNAIYCSPKCKSEYWLYGKNAQKVQSAEQGTISKRDYLVTHKESEVKLKRQKTIPLKGVIDDKTTNLDDIPEKIVNPAYKGLKNRILGLKQRLKNEQHNLGQLELRKKNLESKNPILTTTAVGALAGTVWKNIRNKKLDFWSSVLNASVGAVAGLGIGWILKGQIEKEIKALTTNVIPKIQDEIDSAQRIISLKKLDLSKLTKLVGNPDFVKIKEEELQKTELPKADISNENFAIDEISELDQRIICSTDLKRMNFKSLDFKGDWHQLLGKPSVNFKLAVFGKPGQGKSTFSLQLANYLANNFGRVLYVSGEEGFSKTMKDKLQTNGAFGKNLYIADVRSGEELIEVVPKNSYHFIFIDSLNNMSIDENDLLKIEENYKNSAVITISQTTKKGEFRGSQEILHNADITLKVEVGLAECIKNRFRPTGFEFTVFQQFNG